MSRRRRIGAVPRELAARLLETLCAVAGVQSAVVFSLDGFELAAHPVEAGGAARVAAIGSSLAALGGAISHEAGLHDFERTTIESRDGTVTIMRIDAATPLALAVVADRKATLGQLLWATRQCCQSLARVLGE